MGKPAQSRSIPTELPPPKRPRPAPAQSSSYQSPTVDDDDIQEVVPVKSEPGGGIAADNSGYVGDQGAGAVALDDTYADGSGMIDPNTGLPLAGADGNKGRGSGNFISSNMEVEDLDPLTKRSRRARVWKCKLCHFS